MDEEVKSVKDKMDNKNGKKSFVLSVVSIVLYTLALIIVVNAFRNNIFIGFLSILLIPLVTVVQKNAVHHAELQREINGKGFFALIFAKYLVPLFAICAMLGLVFGIGLLI